MSITTRSPLRSPRCVTPPSMNVFRRFTVDRAKMLEFYGDVLGLKPLPTFGMPGGSQMSRFQVGTSEIKLTGATPGRQDKSGAVRDTTGLRVFTFFFPDEAALTARFTAHGYAAPAFRAREGGTRGAMVLDPDGQWVELVDRDERGTPTRPRNSRSASPCRISRRAARSTASSWAWTS